MLQHRGKRGVQCAFGKSCEQIARTDSYRSYPAKYFNLPKKHESKSLMVSCINLKTSRRCIQEYNNQIPNPLKCTQALDRT